MKSNMLDIRERGLLFAGKHKPQNKEIWHCDPKKQARADRAAKKAEKAAEPLHRDIAALIKAQAEARRLKAEAEAIRAQLNPEPPEPPPQPEEPRTGNLFAGLSLPAVSRPQPPKVRDDSTPERFIRKADDTQWETRERPDGRKTRVAILEAVTDVSDMPPPVQFEPTWDLDYAKFSPEKAREEAAYLAGQIRWFRESNPKHLPELEARLEALNKATGEGWTA